LRFWGRKPPMWRSHFRSFQGMAIDELFTPGTVPNNHEIWPDCLEISFASLQAPAPGVQDDGAKSWSPKAASGGAADSTLFGHKSFQAIYRVGLRGQRSCVHRDICQERAKRLAPRLRRTGPPPALIGNVPSGGTDAHEPALSPCWRRSCVYSRLD